jgi:hypothetical protein
MPTRRWCRIGMFFPRLIREAPKAEDKGLQAT